MSPLYTCAEIRIKLEILEPKIAKAETAQRYGAGAQVTLDRGDLKAMYSERERWEKLYAVTEAREQGTALAQPSCYRREA